jgi:hypothetical protein
MGTKSEWLEGKKNLIKLIFVQKDLWKYPHGGHFTKWKWTLFSILFRLKTKYVPLGVASKD